MNTADAQQVINYLSEQIKEQAVTIAMLRANADSLRTQLESAQSQGEDTAGV